MATVDRPEAGCKRCSKCGEVKPLTAFRRKAEAFDGRRTDCAICQAAWNRAYYVRTFAQQQKLRRRIFLRYLKDGRAAEQQRKARVLNRDKIRARDAVKTALRRGHLQRQPCSVCGESKAFAHHADGYARENRLRVIWLCHLHHQMAHGRLLHLSRPSS